jgi:hypothetical protein
VGYTVTNKDRMSMIELMKHAWHVNFKATQEKGTNYIRWDIQAINPNDGTYYSTDGASLSEAVDNWFLRTAREQGKITTLYEEKSNFINITEAQFYG